MKTNETGSNVLLTGIVLLANFDLAGLMDYGLKAVVGGAVWLGYKLTADYLAERKKMQNKR
jgi:hypothetical protein